MMTLEVVAGAAVVAGRCAALMSTMIRPSVTSTGNWVSPLPSGGKVTVSSQL